MCANSRFSGAAANGTRESSGGSRTLVRLLIAAAVGIHLYVVYTIAAQPLDVNQHLDTGRSIIWALHNDTIHRVGPGADFFAVYHAGRALEHGLSPYLDVEHPGVTPYFYPFRYLPIVGLVAGRCLIRFPPQMAYWMWIAMLETMLGLLILTFVRRLGDRRRRCFTACALLLSSPYALELHMGQFTFATLSLLCISILVLESPRAPAGRIIGAVSYGTAALLKVFPLVTAPALIRHRRYWPSLIVAATAIVASSVPYFAAHRSDLELFYGKNWTFSDPADNMHSGNFGFIYFVYLILTDVQAGTLAEKWVDVAMQWRLIVLAVTAAIVLCTRDDRVGIGVGAMIFAHFLSYRDVWEHHMSGVVVIGLLVLWSVTEGTSGPRQQIITSPAPSLANRGTVLMVVCLVLLALPTPSVFFDHAKDPAVFEPSFDWPSSARYALVLSKVGPTAILYASCMFILCKAGFARPWAVTPRA